jgi:glycosyltransferase involved in cell wall biosynthesis
VSVPTVSILVPTYNCAHYLPLLCNSIKRQTDTDFEALIWDDGSMDNTAEAIAPFLNDRRFQFLRSPNNQGLNKSWFELLSRARGEFWCSPGADDILFPDFLARRLARMREDPAATLIHGPPIHIDENGNERNDVSLPVRPPPTMEGGDVLLALLQHNFINQPSALVRRTSTERVMSHWRADWKYAPDWHFWILHAATGQHVLYDPAPAHNYRIHSRSLSYAPAQDFIRRAEERLVPLVACSGAAGLSEAGLAAWRRWRRALYALWLRRAWVLRRESQLDKFVSLGTHAYQSRAGATAPALTRELFNHASDILWFSAKEALARRKRSFQTAGLAQMKHPLFIRS